MRYTNLDELFLRMMVRMEEKYRHRRPEEVLLVLDVMDDLNKLIYDMERENDEKEV